MTSQRLTKKAVDELHPRDKQYVCYDGSLPGFGVKVYPSGRKSFVVEYRPGSGGRRIANKRLSIGRVGTVTCEQARDVARTKLAEVRLGNDPSVERDADRKMPTFREMAQRYLDDEAPRRLKPATIRNYEINIRRHANPIIGSLKISEIVRVDVAAMHNAIGGKSKIMANRTLETVSAVFRYAQEAGLVPEDFNPTRGVRSFKEPRRERYLSVDEFMRLGEALRLAESDGVPWANLTKEKQSKHAPTPENQTTVFSTTAIDAIRMLIFTGCRLREVLHLTWKEVDLERGLPFLADSKTGARAVVLNRQAQDLLQRQARNGQFVFPSDQRDIDPDRQLIQRPLADLNKP